MPQIRVKNGMSKGALFQVEDQPLIIGREPTCAIQILDKGASRNHSEIFRIGEMCFIRDLSSRNGTYVNEVRVDEELLREGDRVQIGSTVLVFESTVHEEERDVEFTHDEEEHFGQTLTLRLEDLSEMNVTAEDGDTTSGKRLRALYHLSRLLSEEREQQSLTEKLLKFACETIDADNAYLFLPDASKGNIVPLGHYNRRGKKSPKVSRSIIRRSLQEKRAILTSDAMQDARFSAKESIVLKQIHSVICAPLSSAETEKSGVLYLASDSPQQVFNEDDLEIAGAMTQLAGLALDNIRIQQEQRETLMNTIRGIVRASEMRDPTLKGHSERIARYATVIARELKLPTYEQNNIQLAALLCDLGLLVIDESSLANSQYEQGSSLEERQYLATMEIIREMNPPAIVSEAIQYMNERLDGSGPEKLQGKKIPRSAQILAVARAFEKKADSVSDVRREEAIRRTLVEMNSQSEKLYDPEVVKALLIAYRHGALQENSRSKKSD